MSHWMPPDHRPKTDERSPGPVSIYDAAGRLVRVVKPDLRGLPCRRHAERACKRCEIQIDVRTSWQKAW